VVRGTTNPAPCCHLANDTDLLTPVLWAVAGDNKQIGLWPADPFTRIDPKFNQVVPWSLHTFPENFMQISPAVFARDSIYAKRAYAIAIPSVRLSARPSHGWISQ